MAPESSPLERNKPTGTSAIKCARTASSSIGRNFLAAEARSRGFRVSCAAGEAAGSHHGRARGTRRRSGTCSSTRSEEHTSELQSRLHLVCRLLLEKKTTTHTPSALFQTSWSSPNPPRPHLLHHLLHPQLVLHHTRNPRQLRVLIDYDRISVSRLH